MPPLFDLWQRSLSKGHTNTEHAELAVRTVADGFAAVMLGQSVPRGARHFGSRAFFASN